MYVVPGYRGSPVVIQTAVVRARLQREREDRKVTGDISWITLRPAEDFNGESGTMYSGMHQVIHIGLL